jgi:hypothetical protein
MSSNVTVATVLVTAGATQRALVASELIVLSQLL